MLRVLDDRRTRLLPQVTGAVSPGAVLSREDTGTLIVSISSFEDSEAITKQLARLRDSVRAAARVVFDLRGSQPRQHDLASCVFSQAGLDDVLPSDQTALPTLRWRKYEGFPTQVGRAPYFETQTGIEATKTEPGRKGGRIAFVIRQHTDVPAIAWALQRTGQGSVVMEGSGIPEPSRPCVPPPGAPPFDFVVALTDGLSATVRLWDAVGLSDQALSADLLVSPDAPGGAALRAAIESTAPSASTPTVANKGAEFEREPERGYQDMAYPGLPYRVLAAYRWWNAIHYFFPHASLTGEDWDLLLPEFILSLVDARNTDEYGDALSGMLIRIHDSHASVDLQGATGAAYWAFLGWDLTPGVLLQFVEGLPVVVAVSNDDSTRQSGIRLGDIVVSVDGRPWQQRKQFLERRWPASTPQALDGLVAAGLLGGQAGTSAEVVVRAEDGRERRLLLSPRVRRSATSYAAQIQLGRSANVVQILPGNVGYVDLTRLTVPMVQEMFETLRETEAIVFDGRGYPNATDSVIASRLATQSNSVVSEYRIPIVVSPDVKSTRSATLYQRTRQTPWRYERKTVLLVDERAASQAEHLGLWLKAANGTTFVGSPTAGVYGNSTRVLLPGGISAGFTGMDVRLPGGGQLQRIGLRPDISVKPTIAGIRAGRDEVLERALAFIKDGK